MVVEERKEWEKGKEEKRICYKKQRWEKEEETEKKSQIKDEDVNAICDKNLVDSTNYYYEYDGDDDENDDDDDHDDDDDGEVDGWWG